MTAVEFMLDDVYNRHVKYDEAVMEWNKRIAIEFVEDFKEFLSNLKQPIDVDILTQGSAFEGIKVGAPNEFDFLLVLEYENVKATGIMNVRGKQWTSEFREKLKGYWNLTAEDSWDPRAARFCDENHCLSIKKYKTEFQKAVNKYTEEVRSGKCVKGNPSINNPALTIKVLTAGGREISIDMSVCIKVTERARAKYYIAKQHVVEESEMFWLEMNSQDELHHIVGIREKIKMNYRIAKFLLQPQVPTSYVVKTAFLHLYCELPDRILANTMDFIKHMMNRLHDSFHESKLNAHFNKDENILARYNEIYLNERANYFKRLCGKNDTYSGFETVVNQLENRAVLMMSPAVPYCVQSVDDDDDDDDDYYSHDTGRGRPMAVAHESTSASNIAVGLGLGALAIGGLAALGYALSKQRSNQK